MLAIMGEGPDGASILSSAIKGPSETTLRTASEAILDAVTGAA